MIAECSSCGARNRIPAARLNQRARCAHCKAGLLPMARPVEIAEEVDFLELVERSPMPVVVDFWAPWCAPCRVVAPEVAKLAREYAGKIVVAKLNTEQLPALASRHRIEGIPTLAVFHRGSEVRRTSGAMPAARMAAALGLGALAGEAG